MQKTLLILGVVCFQVAFGVITEADLSPGHKECIKEFNFDTDVFLKHFNEDGTVTEGDPDINAISLCTLKRQHYLKDDDSLDDEKFKDALVNKYFVKRNYNFDNPTEVASNGLEACKSVQGSDLADTIVKHHNCIVLYFNTAA